MPPEELELAESSIWVWTWKDMVKRNPTKATGIPD